MNVLAIAIGRKALDHWPVVATHSRPGGAPVVIAGQLTLDEEALRAQATPAPYGRMLGEALFQGSIRDAFVRALPASQGERLDVLLDLGDEALRASVRWEWLCAPTDENWPFLALNSQTPYARYIPRSMGAFFRPLARRDLAALIVVANPSNLADFRLKPFDIAAAVERVRLSLGDIPARVLADVHVVPAAAGPPTLDALIEELTRQPAHLLHVVCHGAVSRTGETYLFLDGPDGRVHDVSATALIDRMRLAQGAYGLPHLVFLSACETASAEGEQALGGMGQRMVRELGFPAVVAMTERVSVDTALAFSSRFYAALRSDGNPAHALADAGAALASRHDAMVPALFTCAPGQSLFTDDRPLDAADVRFGIDATERLLPERAPVLLLDELEPDGLGAFSRLARSARQTLPASGSAGVAIQLDWLSLLAELDALARDALEMSFAALALGKAPAAYDATQPFMGMNAFQAGDRRFFFGRRKLVETVAALTESPGLVGVFGPSGCGKSSLVLAGVVPALQQTQPGLRPVTIRPGRNPLSQLDQALNASADGLLVVDQFEEMFTLVEDEAVRRAFLDRVLDLSRSLPVVLTMRSEFLDDCARYPAFYAALQPKLQHIAPMTGDELSTAIQAQASAVNLAFEADLVNTILDDVAGEPGAMPLLQHGLLRLWQRRHGRQLAASEYRKIGGIQEAIAQTAEGVYLRLSVEDQSLMRRVLLRLVRLDENDLRRDARRREQFDQLLVDENERAAVNRLVARLADEKLLATGVNPASGEHEVELTHEALIQHWARLREWIEADRADLKLQQKVAAAAANWVDLDRDPGSLYRGALLAQAEERLQKQPNASNLLEREFLVASVAERDREAKEEEHQRQIELELANERAAKAEATAQAQARRAKRLRIAVVVLALLLVVPTLLGVRRLQQSQSAWERVAGLPANQVNALAAQLPAGTDALPTYCAGTSDVGLGCSQDGRRWNIYQQSLPIGDPGRSASWFARLFPNRSYGIRAVAIDPTDASRVLVSVYDHGVWRSSDGGRVLTPSNDGLPEQGAVELVLVRDLALAVFDQEHGNAIYASEDGGNSWRLVGGAGAPPLYSVYSVLVAADGTTVYAGAEAGIFSGTSDDAWQWTQEVETDSVEALAADERGQIFAATWQPDSRKGSLLRWQPGETPIYLAAVDRQPRSLSVTTGANQQPIAFVLLWNKEILAINESGERVRIGSYPDWSPLSTHLTLLALPASATTDHIPALWLGHQDGLFEYEDWSNLERLLN